jgi:hypothetical protein
MSYTAEITELTISDDAGEPVVKIGWMDDSTLEITSTSILTNSAHWPTLSAAIQDALTKMEQSVKKEHQ